MKLLFFLEIKLLLSIFCIVCSVFSFSQPPIEKEQELHQIFVEENYQSKYNKQLRRVRRVYPLALKAAKIIDDIELELATEASNRKRKKIVKEFHSTLKEDYLYVIKDLYLEEGVLLMKLIHRETGFTVGEIIAKYRGKFRSEFYDQIGKIWKQDLDVKYDPLGKDWITEQVIRDVLSKEVFFDPEPKKLSKEEFKVSMHEYRANKRAAKKLMREQRRAASEVEKK